MENQNRSYTPRDTFSAELEKNRPQALAWVRGGTAWPALSGLVKFFETPYGGTLVEAEVFGLPNQNRPGSSDFYAMHIHEGGDCDFGHSEPFGESGGHYNPGMTLHPYHSGDLPPLLANQGYAWTAFYDKRFTWRELLGRTVIIHAGVDDFTSQPSGNSGNRIGCGVIRVNQS